MIHILIYGWVSIIQAKQKFKIKNKNGQNIFFHAYSLAVL